MCTFDFDLPNITSIDRRTVLCFTCWEKHLVRPSWKPRHKPPLHYPGLLLTSLGWWIFHGLLRPSPNHCCHLLATAVSTDHGNHKSGYRGTQGWESQCLLSRCIMRGLGSLKLDTEVNLYWEQPTFFICVQFSHILKDQKLFLLCFFVL